MVGYVGVGFSGSTSIQFSQQMRKASAKLTNRHVEGCATYMKKQKDREMVLSNNKPYESFPIRKKTQFRGYQEE